MSRRYLNQFRGSIGSAADARPKIVMPLTSNSAVISPDTGGISGGHLKLSCGVVVSFKCPCAYAGNGAYRIGIAVLGRTVYQKDSADGITMGEHVDEHAEFTTL